MKRLFGRGKRYTTIALYDSYTRNLHNHHIPSTPRLYDKSDGFYGGQVVYSTGWGLSIALSAVPFRSFEIQILSSSFSLCNLLLCIPYGEVGDRSVKSQSQI